MLCLFVFCVVLSLVFLLYKLDNIYTHWLPALPLCVCFSVCLVSLFWLLYLLILYYVSLTFQECLTSGA